MVTERRRIAVVTGVSRRAGIGAAIARRLAASGVDLFLHSWAPHDAEQPYGADVGGVDALLAELCSTGRQVQHLACDFADPVAPAELFGAALDAFGSVDVLVANHARSSRQSVAELTAAELDLSYAVNTRATLLLVKEFAGAHDDARDGGAIVLFTSGQHLRPAPAEIPYMASKGAIQQITKTLAAELAARGITVNAVNPGPTDTGWAGPETEQLVTRLMPTGRWGRPDDAARLVAWLCGPDGRWVTGQVIDSEGGFGYLS